MFEKNDYVMTPQGMAEVAYRRMAGPDYSTVQAYGVRLLAQWKDPCYSGTVYPADQVTRCDNWCYNCKRTCVSMDPGVLLCRCGKSGVVS